MRTARMFPLNFGLAILTYAVLVTSLDSWVSSYVDAPNPNMSKP